MKFELKRDIWGVVFSAGIGVCAWLLYDVGKITGSIQAYEEQNEFLNSLLEEAKKAQTKQ